ncbi:4Fe-4S dicluster domain-containing protein [Sporohalobacter salinus]|uniref:4Fe-4S dicluster domain-containing protein n=1 Tax=Sporohalobacter salinus TaxID=1494606 RepID=UPI001960E871|nr:4Fe-4S dicluster domain-containing protein [Sporohalobacter salinus]MBM7622600.1 carbon-monoxide dehydrogenase iron sulfur subunit [Sporohalobacter salinus]
MKRIHIDREACKACKNCIIACMLQHSEAESIHNLNLTDINNQARNKIVLNNNDEVVPLFCRHCRDSECLTACMSGALSRDKKTGHIICNQKQCVGCWMCVMSCSYGMVMPEKASQERTLKCDMCGDDQPQCVENCPTGAIKVIELDMKEKVIK